MPRYADPANFMHQERTRRWREKLEKGRIPESSDVDVAVAAAVTAVSAALKSRGLMTGERREVVGMILDAAVHLLVAKGYNEAAARRIMTRRLSRWGSLDAQKKLIERAGIRLDEMPKSPDGA